MDLFVRWPLLAVPIGAVLMVLGRRAGRRTATRAGLAWLVYAAYELGMQRRWLCSGECNIRVDLFVIYAALLVATVAAIVSLLRAGPGRSHPDPAGRRDGGPR